MLAICADKVSPLFKVAVWGVPAVKVVSDVDAAAVIKKTSEPPVTANFLVAVAAASILFNVKDATSSSAKQPMKLGQHFNILCMSDALIGFWFCFAFFVCSGQPHRCGRCDGL